MQRRQLTYCVLLFSYGSGPADTTVFLTVLDTNDIAAYKKIKFRIYYYF